MPLFDFECKKCGKIAKDVFIRKLNGKNGIFCECGEKMTKLVSAPNVYCFKPFWHPNLEKRPIYIESKKQLKSECEKRGLIPAMLD